MKLFTKDSCKLLISTRNQMHKYKLSINTKCLGNQYRRKRLEGFSKKSVNNTDVSESLEFVLASSFCDLCLQWIQLKCMEIEV